MPTFAELGLSEPLCRSLDQLGVVEPTQFQESTIAPQLEGRDLLGLAAAGAERILAFALPLLQRLGVPAVAALPKEPRALVLANDVETAESIGQCLGDCARFLPVNHIVATDGSGWNQQDRLLRTGAEIIVATLRRLLDLRRERAVLLRAIEIVVIDDVEKLLDRGLDQELNKLLVALPAVHQTVAFAAVAAPTLRAFASEWMRDPVSVAGPRARRKTRPVDPAAPQRAAGRTAPPEPGELPAWLDGDSAAKAPVPAKPKKRGKTRTVPVAAEPPVAEPPPAEPPSDELPAWLDDDSAAKPPVPPKSKKRGKTRTVSGAAEPPIAEPPSDELPAWLDDDSAAKPPVPPKSKKRGKTRTVPVAAEPPPAEPLPPQPSSPAPTAPGKTASSPRRGKPKAGSAKKRKRP